MSLSHSSSIDPMTARQRTVLKGLLLGKSNREIARELNLTDYTIKYHCRGIYQRFGVTNRVGLFGLFLQQTDCFPPDIVATLARTGRHIVSPMGKTG